MTVICVTVDTNHLFSDNPLASQHRLRFNSIIKRQNWEVPFVRNLEYDQYDNPSTVYLIWRDSKNIARGVSRLCRTDRPFMLKDHFMHLVHHGELPEDEDVLEGSRFCIDNSLPIKQRKRIAHELILAYLEYGLANSIKEIIGVMYPIYWKNLFEKNGWKPKWIGDLHKTPDGKKSRAAILPISSELLANVRKHTGILSPVINYGTASDTIMSQSA